MQGVSYFDPASCKTPHLLLIERLNPPSARIMVLTIEFQGCIMDT